MVLRVVAHETFWLALSPVKDLSGADSGRVLVRDEAVLAVYIEGVRIFNLGENYQVPLTSPISHICQFISLPVLSVVLLIYRCLSL